MGCGSNDDDYVVGVFFSKGLGRDSVVVFLCYWGNY